MKIETAVNCRDKVYVCSDGYVRPLTVGQIRVYYTKSEGLDDNWNFIGSIRTQDGNGNTNTDPMPEKYEEEYMCVETGIGSGSVWKLGETCWATEEEAKVACDYRRSMIDGINKEGAGYTSGHGNA